MPPHRLLFWHIGPVWVFYAAAALALCVCAAGLAGRVAAWSKGRRSRLPSQVPRRLLTLAADGLTGRRLYRQDRAAGLMHGLIMWGFLLLLLGTLSALVDHYLYRFLTGGIYLAFEICLEAAGVMVAVGLVWGGLRRYLGRIPRLERRAGALVVPAWMLTVVLSGFLVEGARLAAQGPGWGAWSWVGYRVSILWSGPEAAMSAYPYLWWGHATVSLGFIALFPFSSLFHVLAAPVSMYLGHEAPGILAAVPEAEGEAVVSFRDLCSRDACTRCGRCVDACPVTGAGEAFTPRDCIVGTGSRLRMLHPFVKPPDSAVRTEAAPEWIWHCTTCRACVEVCPVCISPPDALHAARSAALERGTSVPSKLIGTLETLYKYHNPWEAAKNRAGWADGLTVPEFTGRDEADRLCYFVGCTTSRETRARELARAFVRVLAHCRVPFGTLGKKEPCCGAIAREVGEVGLLEEQVGGCLDLFTRRGVREVVASSPHCFHTFRTEYAALHARRCPGEPPPFRVRHYTEVLSGLVRAGAMGFTRPLDACVTFHDPCYLGRHNRVFDAPREVISAIPGVRFVEMAHHREHSLCCGGGGGRMWQEDPEAEFRMSEVRIREAARAGARVVITACPLCLVMLEDARKTAGLEETLVVMDLNEVVVSALGLDAGEGES